VKELPDALASAPAFALADADVVEGRLAALQARAAVAEGPLLRGDVPYGPDAGPCLHLVSAELAEDALLDRHALYSSAGGWASLNRAGLGQAVLNADEPAHMQQRRTAAPSVAGPALQRRLPHFLAIVDREIASWGRDGRLDLVPAVRRLAFDAFACGVGGMGNEVAPRAFDALSLLLDGPAYPHESRDAFLPRAAVARATFLAVLADDVARRRADSGRGDGSMSDLLVAAVPRGDGEHDAAVAYIAILLVAGHETGMTMYSRALWELACRPPLAAALRDELARAGGTRDVAPAVDVVDRLPALDRFMLEIGRLFPPVVNIPRLAAEDFDLAGFRVRAGTRLVIAIGGLQRRTDTHDRPDAFDPDRWLDPATERARRPFSYLVFAGGVRHCLGVRLAQIEFKAIVSRALLRYDLAPADPAPVHHGGFWVARPSRPMPVTLSPR